MSRHRYSQKILPKYQDTDTEVRYMNEGAVRYMLNSRTGKRSEHTKGARTNIKGTLLIPNALLPQGQNVCLGAVTNKSGDILVFFNWNENRYNGIYLYNPSLSDPIQLLFSDTPDNIILGFHQYYRIAGTKARIVNDEHLFWTDAYNAPRYLNLKWALDYKKKKSWDIQQVDSDILDFNILNFRYNGQPVSLFVSNLTDILQSNPKINDYFEVENCECSITLTEKESGTCEISTTSPKIRIVPQNFYPKPHNERQIDLVCYPPSTAPRIKLKKDTTILRNLISGNTWQFRAKYIYKDGNHSVWSAWSKSLNTSSNCAKKYNYVEIDYTDMIFDCLNDEKQLHLIDKVVLGYRNTNSGELYSFITIKQCEIPKGRQTYKFYNDIYATAEPEYDDLQPYHTVPLQCGALSSVGNTLVTGDVAEGYHEDCFDFDLDVKYTTEEKSQYNGKAKAYIYIKMLNKSVPVVQCTENADTYNFGTGTRYSLNPYISPPFLSNKFTKTDLDAFGHQLGEKGFVGYIAGTDNKAISKQEIGYNLSLETSDADHKIIKVVTQNQKNEAWDALIDHNDTFRQVLEFDGLPDGKHIIRLASHWCSYGDKLAKGSAYDLSNGTAYQKTSTNVESVNGVEGAYEAVVEIVNGIMVTPVPTFIIRDCSFPAAMIDNPYGGLPMLVHMSLVQGYVIDADSVSQEDVNNGIRVERATVRTLVQDLNINTNKREVVTYTDHNGYFFHVTIKGAGGGLTFGLLKVDKGKDKDWNDIPGIDGDMKFLWQEDDFYNGTLSNLAIGDCTPFNNNSDNFQAFLCNVIVPPAGSGASNIRSKFRTRIKGRLVDTLGNPVTDATVVATDTIRLDKTDMDGKFSILLYSNYFITPLNTPLAYRRYGTLYISGGGCINGWMERGFSIRLGGVPHFNNERDFDLGDIVVDWNYNELESTYYLKNGGTYDFGVTLMDRALRKTTVISDEKKHRVRLPFLTEKIQKYFPNITTDVNGVPVTADTQATGYFKVKIKPVSKPPVWATHLYTLRTDDQVYADYIQMAVSDVKYVVNYDVQIVDSVETPNPVTTTFGAADANEIYLDLVTSFSQYKDRISESAKGWTFEKGDRLRFLYKADGTLYSSFIEVEIKEQRGNYFVIPLIETLDEILQGETVEIFRLKTKTTKKNFYETAEYIKILNPYTDSRSWEHSEIELNTGDAYRRTRTMYIKNEDNERSFQRNIEDTTPYDNYIEKDNDKGRLDFINDEYKQLRRLSVIRYGGKILAESNLNRIRRFNSEAQLDGDTNYGAITILDDFGDTLFVAQESKCHTRLVGKTHAYLGDGGVATFNTTSFLSTAYYLNDNYGCRNPESYSRCGNSGIFFDAREGVICKYSPQNGIMNISGYDPQYRTSNRNEQPFVELSARLNNIPKELYQFIFSAVSGYNDYDTEVNITFSDVVISKGQDLSLFNGKGRNSNIGDDDVKFKKFTKSEFEMQLDGFTMCYDMETTLWHGYRSYKPSMYGTMNNKYIGFVDGVFHLMEHGEKYNNFFGAQYKSVLHAIMNVSPSDMKFFTNWSVEGNEKWENPYVRVYNSRSFRVIESETPSAKIVRQNGVYLAPFMFDKNTVGIQYPLINGNRLCGETLLMVLENSSDTEVLLFAINIYAGYSGRTNF